MDMPVYLVLVSSEPSPSLKRKDTPGKPWWKRLLTKISTNLLPWKMQDLPESYKQPTMTSQQNSLYYGPPPPITELTMEQSFKLRRLEDLLPEAEKEDIITILLALQRQSFVLGNNLTQLLKEWNKPPRTTDEVLSSLGISSETKDWTTTSATQLNTFVEQVIKIKHPSTVTSVKPSTIYKTN